MIDEEAVEVVFDSTEVNDVTRGDIREILTTYDAYLKTRRAAGEASPLLDVLVKHADARDAARVEERRLQEAGEVKALNLDEIEKSVNDREKQITDGWHHGEAIEDYRVLIAEIRRLRAFPLAHRTDLPEHERKISKEAYESLEAGIASVKAGKVTTLIIDPQVTAEEAAAGEVTVEEAREILTRYNSSHFNNASEHARYSIPANPKWDDDIRLATFISQYDRLLKVFTRPRRTVELDLSVVRAEIESLNATRANLRGALQGLRDIIGEVQGPVTLATLHAIMVADAVLREEP